MGSTVNNLLVLAMTAAIQVANVIHTDFGATLPVIAPLSKFDKRLSL